MADELVTFKRCLYYIGLFPKYNDNVQEFTASKLRALLLSITYSMVIILTVCCNQPPPEFHISKFKAYGDVLIFAGIASCMLCNHTVHAGKLTQILHFMSSTKLPFKYLVHFAHASNVLFPMIAIGLLVNFLARLENYKSYLLPALIEAYSFECNHLINSTCILFIVLTHSRLKTLNRTLEELHLQPQQQHVVLVSGIIREHNLVNNAVELFNNVFGLERLLVKVYEMINVLSMLDFLLGDENSIDLTGIYAWSLYVCFKGLIHTHLCERLTNEGKRTVNLAFNVLEQFEYSRDAILKEKLFILTQQCASRCPRFTAWGFFNIDHSMIFTFANLTITYVIVLVQLKLQKTYKPNSKF